MTSLVIHHDAGHTCCECGARRIAARDKLTNDWSKVTCRECLEHKPWSKIVKPVFTVLVEPK
jgi:hypothetical protein